MVAEKGIVLAGNTKYPEEKKYLDLCSETSISSQHLKSKFKILFLHKKDRNLQKKTQSSKLEEEEEVSARREDWQRIFRTLRSAHREVEISFVRWSSLQ